MRVRSGCSGPTDITGNLGLWSSHPALRNCLGQETASVRQIILSVLQDTLQLKCTCEYICWNLSQEIYQLYADTRIFRCNQWHFPADTDVLPGSNFLLLWFLVLKRSSIWILRHKYLAYTLLHQLSSLCKWFSLSQSLQKSFKRSTVVRVSLLILSNPPGWICGLDSVTTRYGRVIWGTWERSFDILSPDNIWNQGRITTFINYPCLFLLFYPLPRTSC